MTQKIDPQEEILAAACAALDSAHMLLSLIVRYDGKVTPEFLERAKAWIDGEYDPGERRPKPCEHIPMKAALDGSVGCLRCGIDLGHVD